MPEGQLIFSIDGSNSNSPANYQELEIETSFYGDGPRLSVGDLEFNGLSAKRLLKWRADGLTGGPGITEGVPFKVDLLCGTERTNLLDGCIDLAASSAAFSKDQVKAPAKQSGGVDFINTAGDSFRVEYLSTLAAGEPGRITDADYVKINYMPGKYPQYVEILLASVSVYVIAKEVYESIKRLSEVIITTTALIGTAGFGSIAAGPIYSIAEIIILTAYIAVTIYALAELIKNLFRLLFPFVFYHLGMRFSTIFKRGCEYLGFIPSSSLLFSADAVDLVYMPPKDYQGAFVGERAIGNGLYQGLFGDFLREAENFFCAKVKPIGKTLYLEPEIAYNEDSGFIIPDLCIEFTETNASEIVSNYYIGYANDRSDLWSYNGLTGVNYQVTISPKVTLNKKNNLLKNLVRIDLPYSLSTVKTSKNELESVMTSVYNGFAGLINTVSSIFGGGNPVTPISQDAQTYCLQLDSHFTDTARLVLLKDLDGKVRSDFSDVFGADKLWSKYHFVKSPVPQAGNPKGNQWIQYPLDVLPMCCEDFNALINKNYCTYQGKKARILNNRFNPFQNQSTNVRFEVNETYTNNLKETFIKDGGR